MNDNYMKDKQILTLVWVVNNNQILLGYKKRGHGKGLWNGFGGKVEQKDFINSVSLKETIVRAAKRELFEESKLICERLQFVGILTFDFDDKPFLMEVHNFTTDKYSGEPQESEEMIPKWFPVSELPLDNMWTDVALWFPLLIKGSKYVGHFKIINNSIVDKYEVKAIEDDSPIEPIDSLQVN